jgi:hypothetical protein
MAPLPIHLEKGRKLNKLNVLLLAEFANLLNNNEIWFVLMSYLNHCRKKKKFYLLLVDCCKEGKGCYNRLACCSNEHLWREGVNLLFTRIFNTVNPTVAQFWVKMGYFLGTNVHLFSFLTTPTNLPSLQGYGNIIGIDCWVSLTPHYLFSNTYYYFMAGRKYELVSWRVGQQCLQIWLPHSTSQLIWVQANKRLVWTELVIFKTK